MKDNLFIRQLGEYFESFLPKIRGSSKNTISSYADSFAIFFQFMQEEKDTPHHLIKYKHFTAAVFDGFVLWLGNERRYSDASIRQRISAILSFLKYASRREMAALNAYSVAAAIKLPSKKAGSELPYFDMEEMRILLNLPNPDAYLGKRDLALLSFLYDTGARAQELCDTRCCDIRFGSPTKVTLHGKGNKIREVPISEEVRKLVLYHLKNNNPNYSENRELPLFSSQTNEKMTTACVRGIVKKYVHMAKMEHPSLFLGSSYSPHSFRHSKAVHLVESGVNLIYIRNFLGHSTITSTEIYVRVGQAVVIKALTERKIPRIASETPDNGSISTSLPSFIINAR